MQPIGGNPPLWISRRKRADTSFGCHALPSDRTKNSPVSGQSAPGLDPSRHTVIYLPNPLIGVRGIHEEIVGRSAKPPRTWARG